MLDYTYLIGVLGAAVIVAAWASAIRTPPPPLSLSSLYAAGSLLLTVYALLRDDPIFTILNALAFLLAVVNILRVHDKHI